MNYKSFAAIGPVLAAAVFASPALADGNAEAGATVFKKCMVCHTAEEGKNKVGPSLYGVIGRTPGTAEGYKYSKAMTDFGTDHVWDEATLTTYLHAPREVVKGTKMTFAGLKDDQDIANVIAYLKSVVK